MVYRFNKLLECNENKGTNISMVLIIVLTDHLQGNRMKKRAAMVLVMWNVQLILPKT